MYAAVPRITPRVGMRAGEIVGACDRPPSCRRPVNALAKPKSSTFTVPSRVN